MYQDTLFLFPDFDQISLKEDESGWEVDYDGDWKDFEPSYQNIISKLENNRNMPVKLLVERNMFLRHKLTDVNIPECIFLTWSYEKVFENEDSPLKLIVPETTEELYDMMCQTPDLCGTFEIKEEGNIYWDLYDDIQRAGGDRKAEKLALELSSDVNGDIEYAPGRSTAISSSPS